MLPIRYCLLTISMKKPLPPIIHFNHSRATLGDVALAALMRQLLAALATKGIFTRQELDDILLAATLDIDKAIIENIPVDEWQTRLQAKELLHSIASGKEFGF